MLLCIELWVLKGHPHTYSQWWAGGGISVQFVNFCLPLALGLISNLLLYRTLLFVESFPFPIGNSTKIFLVLPIVVTTVSLIGFERRQGRPMLPYTSLLIFVLSYC